MPPVCSAVAELNRTAAGEVVGVVLDDPAELLVPLVDAAAVVEELEGGDEAEELEALEELGELEVGAVGWKLAFLAPKPTFDAKRPPTETESVSLLPVRTSWPPALSDAVTCALAAMFGLLMALIRSPTVSVPVDANVVVLVPSLTVIVPFLGIPRVRSAVFADSGTVPVPVAGEPVLAALEEDVAELACEACTALCNAAVSWASTRACASLVAMLAMPLASLDERPPMAEISALLNAELWVWLCAWLPVVLVLLPERDAA